MWFMCSRDRAVFCLNNLQNNALQVKVTLTKAEVAVEVDEVSFYLFCLQVVNIIVIQI